MSRPTVFFLWVYLALPAIGVAATLEGVVTDGVTDAKLGGVGVICRIGEVSQETITDSQGRYRFEGLEQGERAALQFEKIGYVPSPDETDIELLSSDNRLNRLLYARDEGPDYYRKLGDYIASLQALSGFQGKSTFVEQLGLPAEAAKIVREQLVARQPELHADEVDAARGTCKKLLMAELEALDLEETLIFGADGRIILRGSARDDRGDSTAFECVAVKGEDGSWSAALR